MQHRNVRMARLLLPAVFLACSAASSACAAGYAVFTQGASALAQGNAVTAHNSDPSAVFYNPALISKLKGTQMQVGSTAIFAARDFSSSQPGGGSDGKDSSFFPSTLYITHNFDNQVTAGLGVFTPFGLGTEWSGGWDGRYLAVKSSMQTFDINPVVAYQASPNFSVAAGLDLVLLRATIEKKMQSATLAAAGLPFPGGFDIDQKFKGDGKGVGFNLAAAYDVNSDIAIGASYRSQVHIDVDGNGSFASETLPVAALGSAGHTSVTLPPQFTAGVAYKGIDRLLLEGGVRWEGWSKFKELKVALDNGMVSSTPRDWKDSWGLNLGARYQMDPKIALMAGYVYGDSAAPDSTFDPSIPDSKTHVFCAGTEVKLEPFTLSVSYGYQLYQDRKKANSIDTFPATATSAANGRYQSDAHLLALSLGYQF